MPEVLDELDEESRADRAYVWTIRTLYIVAIGMNLLLAYRAVAEDVEVKVFVGRVKARAAQIGRPITASREWRRAVNRMHYQAAEAVEEVGNA